MFNALMGIASREVNTTPVSASGLSAANKLREEATRHEEQGYLEKAKECFEGGIRKAEDLLQRTQKESDSRKIREQLAASHFYYGNFLRKADKLGAEENYKKALEHASHMDSKQPDVRNLYNQIVARHLSFLIKNESVSRENSKQLDPTKALVANARPSKLGLMPLQRQIDASIQEKSKLIDYLFEMALSTLGALEVSNKPSLFLVYAHDNEVHGKSEAFTSKYLIEKLSKVQITLYSDQAPKGEPYASSPEDLKEDGKLEDIVTNQLCLLPTQLRKDVKPVDKVVVCCSEVLGSYLKWPDYETFYQALRNAYLKDQEAYRKDGEQPHHSAVAIREVVRTFSQEAGYRDGFHHVLTEIAFLQIREEALGGKHGIIPVSLTPNSYEQCLEYFIPATTVRMEDMPRLETYAKTGGVVYENQSRHGVLFKLIERVLMGSNEARTFLNTFWRGYSECLSRLNDESSPLGPLEFAQQFNGIFGGISLELHKKIFSTTQQFCDPAWQEVFMQRLIEVLSQEEQKKALQTVSQPLARLGENIDQFKQAYEKSLKGTGELDVLSMYVPVQGIKKGKQGEETVDLEAELERFFASEATVFLLQGVAGTGKSTFNRHLALKKLLDYQRLSTTQNDSPLVFFIELRSIDNPNKQVIEQYLGNKGFAPEQIEALRTHSHQRCIFIFDGYDEIKERNRNFYDLNELWQWENAKFVITSRPEYLNANYQVYFSPNRDGLREVRMAPFSAEQRSHYIQNYVNKTNPPWSVEQYEQELNKLTTLSKELERPIVLRMLLQILPELRKKNQTEKALTLGAVYEQYFQHWWGNWQSRLGAVALTSDEKKARQGLCERRGGFIRQGFAYIQNCALELAKADLISAQDSENFENRYPGVYKAFFADETKAGDDVRKRLLRFNAPFQMKEKQHYEFSHKSMQEYLVARAICPPDFESMKPHPEDVLNQFSLVREPVILDFLVEQVKAKEQFKAYLHAWIEASKDPRASVTVGAANAITILVRAGVQFIGEDFSRIRIPGAKLMQGVFDSVNFSEADLSNVHLTEAWLRNAEFDRAQLSSIEFNEFPALNFSGSVNACCYSPDERWLAIALNNVIEIYDARTLMPIHAINGHEEEVKHIEFSPDGKYLVSVSHNYHFAEEHCGSGAAMTYGNGGFPEGYSGTDTIKFWSIGLDGLNLLKTITESFGQVNGISLSPNGDKLALGSHNGSLRLWEVKDNDVRPLKEFQRQDRAINSVAFSSDGKLLASGGWSGWGFWDEYDNTNIKIWLVEGDSTMPLAAVSGYEEEVASVVFSSSGNDTLLASAGADFDESVKLWLFEDNNLRLLKTFEGGYGPVKFSKNSGWIVSAGNDYVVNVWPVKGESVIPVREFRGHQGSIRSVTFSNNDTQILSSSSEGMAKLWSVGNIDEKFSNISIGHRARVQHIALLPNGQFVSCSTDNVVKLWTISGNKATLLRTLQMQGNWIYSLEFLSNNNVLLATRIDKDFNQSDLLIFLITKGENVKLLETLPQHYMVGNFSTSCSGKYFYYADSLWAIEMERVVRRKSFEYLSDPASAFSPDETLLARASEGKMIELLEVEGDKTTPLKIFKKKISQRPKCLLFSPDQSLIALGGYSDTIDLWSIAKGTQVKSLKGHTSTVASIDFSSKGNLLASSSFDGTAKIWDIASGACLATLGGVGFSISSVVWYEIDEGKYLLTGGGDHIIRLWQVLEEGHQVILRWASHQNKLTLDGASIEGTHGLTSFNQMLLEQKMAKGKPASVPLG